MTKFYAIYRGDKFIDLGTMYELSAKYHKPIKYLQNLSSPSVHKRTGSRGLLLYKIEDEDD